MNGSTSQSTETPATDTPVSGVTEDTPETVSKLEKQFPVIELFGPVIQGEGSQAGNQTMFIRFGGCDYRCEKCDSLHAVIPRAVQANRTMMTAQEIYDQIAMCRTRTGVRWVTFSGGNPAMHKLDELVDLLRANGFYINVETQGTIFQPWMKWCTTVTVSPKSMGMGEKFDPGVYTRFLDKLMFAVPVCVKVVVFSAQDMEFALHIKDITEAARARTFGPPVAYYLSLGNPYPPVLNMDTFKLEDPDVLFGAGSFEKRGPSQVSGHLTSLLLKDYASLSEEVLQDRRLKDFRFLPQLHVLVYGNESER